MAGDSLARSGVYEIRNTVNGKRYVGSSVNVAQRWREHRTALLKGRHHNRHLQAAWSRYGAEAFRFLVIRLCESCDVLLHEQAAIDSLDPEYNIARIAGNTLGTKRTDAARAKIAAKARARVMGPRTSEHSANLSRALKGKKKPASVMSALQAGRRARVFTEGQRAEIAAAVRLSYETRVRSREKSAEHKNSISKAFSKLSAADIRELKRLHAAGTTGAHLSARYGIAASSISQIVRGLRYRWVTDEDPGT